MKETCSYVLFNYDSINNETLIFPTIKGNAVETSELPFWNKYDQYLAKDSYANLIATVTLIISFSKENCQRELVFNCNCTTKLDKYRQFLQRNI